MIGGVLFSLLGKIVVMLLFGFLLKRLKVFSHVAVSVAGGVLHNVGQIGMACILLSTNVLKYYLPFLVLSGTLAGVAIGVAAAILIKRVEVKA